MSEHDPIIFTDVGTDASQQPPLLVVWYRENIHNITTIKGHKWECGWCPPNDKQFSGCNEKNICFVTVRFLYKVSALVMDIFLQCMLVTTKICMSANWPEIR